MNPNLNSLRLALKLCLEDDRLTSDRILRSIKEAMTTSSASLRAQAMKASNVGDNIKTLDTIEFPYLGDTIVRPQEDDAYDPLAVYGAAQPVPFFGGAGIDTISLSLSSDTISF